MCHVPLVFLKIFQLDWKASIFAGGASVWKMVTPKALLCSPFTFTTIPPIVQKHLHESDKHKISCLRTMSYVKFFESINPTLDTLILGGNPKPPIRQGKSPTDLL